MKRLRLAGILVLCVFLLGACSSGAQNTSDSGSGTGQNQKPMEGWQRVISDAKDQGKEDSLRELDQWKNGVRPGEDITTKPVDSNKTQNKSDGSSREGASAPGIDNYASLITVPLNSADMDFILTELVQLGYLKSKTASEDDLKEAVKQIQKDNHLPISGVLDQATVKLLGL